MWCITASTLESTPKKSIRSIWIARAELGEADQLIRPVQVTLTRRGRPRSDTPKQLVSLRLDGEVLERLRAMGPSWQTKLNAALRKVVGL